ncbi:hypothetical protein GGR26_000688 [Lewinella marina]|uniref:SGNH/GDSL hydrolase family protein n=1 Tax=Neolewinella marina TaxID=438751 RepID=A0A2G0CIV1_9BACT|nr:hypothetical protein [Neolewinella marina]NJB84943.1 hypothetical protein [Neolewinella marina]PHK99904.1 hypothetical protein CGL56_02340 [Neolewinella marina]
MHQTELQQFLGRFLLFAGLLLAYGILMFGINEALYRLRPLPLEPSRVLIAGDSHLRQSLNPAAFEDARNISVTSEPYAITYWKLRAILDEVRPDTVLLSFAPGNVSGYTDLMFYDAASAANQFNKAFRVLDLKSLFQDFPVNKKKLFAILIKKHTLYPNLHQGAFIGEFQPVAYSQANTASQRIQRHFRQPGLPPARTSTAMITYLDSIINLCQLRRITPIVVVSSHQPSYVEAVPPEIMTAYQGKLEEFRERGITTIDGLNRAYPPAMFQDADHLNQAGAARFSSDVVTRLGELPAIKNESR